jgi:hypothetical protein
LSCLRLAVQADSLDPLAKAQAFLDFVLGENPNVT